MPRRLTILLLMSYFLIGVAAPQRKGDDRQLKAEFIFRFLEYVKWNSFIWDSQTSFSIGVFGDRKLYEHLVVSQPKSFTMPLSIDDLASVERTNHQVVVLSHRDKIKNLKAIRQLQNCQCLIIADQPNLAQQGAVINFIRKKGRLSFEVNRSTANTNHLSISSRLLALARIVE